MKYDVTIVGAGPGGSTTAKFLSEKGFEVLLVDKCKFPRVKHCGGGLPIKVLERFSYIKDKKLIDSYAYGGNIYSSSLKYKVEVKKDEPFLGMVVRKKFDYDLVKLAIDAGSKFIDGGKVVDIKILTDKAVIFFDDGSNTESEIVVGADGVWSTVGEKTGLVPKRRSTSISLYSEIPLDDKIMDEYFTKKRYGHMHLKVLGLSGYGWVFPKNHHVNIGLGEFNYGHDKTIEKTNLKKKFFEYINILKEQSIIPKNLEIEKIHGAAIPIIPANKTYSDRVILIGDAAGLANPLTGEGIDYAMYTGKIAAEVIAESLTKKDTSAKFLSKYENEWKKLFGKDLKLYYKSVKLWGNRNEKLIKHFSRDEKLSEMVLDIAGGNISIHKCKWKLIRRF